MAQKLTTTSMNKLDATEEKKRQDRKECFLKMTSALNESFSTMCETDDKASQRGHNRNEKYQDQMYAMSTEKRPDLKLDVPRSHLQNVQGKLDYDFDEDDDIFVEGSVGGS